MTYILTGNLQETLYMYSYDRQTNNFLIALNITRYELNNVFIPLNIDL